MSPAGNNLQIFVQTSENYMYPLAKKPPRRPKAPKTAKKFAKRTTALSLRGDKTTRSPGPLVKPPIRRAQSKEDPEEPVQYKICVLEVDSEYLAWDSLARMFSPNCCKCELDSRDAFFWNSRKALGQQESTSAAGMGYQQLQLPAEVDTPVFTPIDAWQLDTHFFPDPEMLVASPTYPYAPPVAEYVSPWAHTDPFLYMDPGQQDTKYF